MNIQYIRLNNDYNFEGVTFSKLNNPRDFDDFDLNFIDLDDYNIWNIIGYKSRDYGSDYKKDFDTICGMIKNTKANVLISLPQNYAGSLNIKNYIGKLIYTLNVIYPRSLDLVFGPTSTELSSLKGSSDFVFINNDNDVVMTKSKIGNKPTTIKNENIMFTTMSIADYDTLEEFLIETKLKKVISESSPEWMNEIKMFDDDEQFEIIKSKEQEIAELMKKISDAEAILKENDKFKSILYTQSDELVEVVFEIFQELLDINLSEFVDKKIEDISFEVDGKIFVGEVKGITSNVKTPNLSQLDNHYTLYMEEHPTYNEEDVFRLLIINHQRKKAILDREPIHESQIKFAEEKYKILIIETTELLKLLEQYRSNTITRVDIIKMFTSVGVLKI